MPRGIQLVMYSGGDGGVGGGVCVVADEEDVIDEVVLLDNGQGLEGSGVIVAAGG